MNRNAPNYSLGAFSIQSHFQDNTYVTYFRHEKNYTIDRAGGYFKVFFKMVFVGFAGSFVCRFGGSVVFVLVGLGY